MQDTEKLARIEQLAQDDEVYQKMLADLAVLEKEADIVLEKLSLKRRGLLWDYIMQCEEISERKLLIACRNMEFAQESPRS